MKARRERQHVASKRAMRRLPGDFQQTPCMAEGRKMVASDERAGKRKLPSKNRRDFPDKQKQFITTNSEEDQCISKSEQPHFNGTVGGTCNSCTEMLKVFIVNKNLSTKESRRPDGFSGDS